MPRILLYRCCPTGEPKAAAEDAPPACTACGQPMRATQCLNDGTTTEPYAIRCIKVAAPQVNGDWEAGTEEEVWVVGTGVTDGGEFVGRVGKGLLCWEGIPSAGLPGGAVVDLSRHGAARKLAAKLTDQ